MLASGQYGSLENILKYLAEVTCVDYHAIYERYQDKARRKKIKKHSYNAKLSWEKNYKLLEKHHIEETENLKHKLDSLKDDLKYEKARRKTTKPEPSYATYASVSSSYNPIQTGPHSYTCSCCGTPMYYDGRCGDGPVCVNSQCYSRIQAAYWNDS